MTATYESLMDAALQLSPDDRCRMASGLWESLGGPCTTWKAMGLKAF